AGNDGERDRILSESCESEDVFGQRPLGLEWPILALAEERRVGVAAGKGLADQGELTRPSSLLFMSSWAKAARSRTVSIALVSSSNRRCRTCQSTGRRLSGSTRLRSHSSLPW